MQFCVAMQNEIWFYYLLFSFIIFYYLLIIQVFAASDSEEKLGKLRETGVISLFNYTDGQLARNVKKMTMGQGVDLIIDTVGGSVFEQSLNW